MITGSLSKPAARQYASAALASRTVVQTGHRALEPDAYCWVGEDSHLEGCDEHQPSHWASVAPPSVPRACLPERLYAKPPGGQPSWAER